VNPDALETMERLAAAIGDFDYRVAPDDFIVYDLARLVDEDRASLDDEEFRRLIDEGVRTHVGNNLQIRADLAGVLRTLERRLDPAERKVAGRVIRSLEDVESDLGNVAVVVRTYTAFLFRQLERSDEPNPDSNEQPDAVARAADLLFESPEDRSVAEAAIDTLARIHSPTSARVLTHAVSEPLLDEDIETKAFAALREFWRLARQYMVYNLRRHAHEDLPYRWFQLLIEDDDVEATDLVLEELLVHGESAIYREDLYALVLLLLRSRDPELQDKVVSTINAPDTPPAVVSMLEEFLREYQPTATLQEDNPWARRKQLSELNRKYLAAAKAFDAGRVEEASTKLGEILAEDRDYPFALMLKRIS
jgi:hypothetical protein